MSTSDERTKKFVNHLRALARDDNPDRGALADLRSGLGKPPGHAPRMHKHVVPYLGEKQSRDDRWFYTVGALFAANPLHDGKETIATCFRKIAVRSDSIAARFTALLGSHSSDLHKHLSYAISLLKSNNLGLNYYKLLDDLIYWDHPERPVQNRWAREFYYSPKAEKKENENE